MTHAPDTRDTPDMEAKVAALRRPSTWPEPTGEVEVVETHMAWVFLTARSAWKMKKPVRWNSADFTTLEARREDCDREVRLNRRLAADVYHGVVPLTRDEAGTLRVDGLGEAVEWLVHMRRLPREEMLDDCIARGAATREDIQRVVGILTAFYRRAPAVEWSALGYRRRLDDALRATWDELRQPRWGLTFERLDAVAGEALDLLAREPDLFEARVEGGRVVEAHGDLRPEHICLEDPPVVIDCLEFDRDLRILDAASELSFLALECERLGAPHLAPVVRETYRLRSGDAPPDRLLRFYRAQHALVRAKVAVWHLADPHVAEPDKWTRRARHYLELAAQPPGESTGSSPGD
ncbi:MAG: hypothetical protein ACQEXJ_14405 [Myxococcota bacterium]